MDCIVARITGQAVPISEVRPGLPPRLIESIGKLMAANPDDRYQTADEAAAALRSMLRPKNAPPGGSATAVASKASVPEPAPKARPTIEAPSPPVPARVHLSKPKRDSLRSRWPKALGLLAAVVVVAVSLLGVTIVLFRLSGDERSESQAETLHANAGAVLPAGGAEVRQSSLETSHTNDGVQPAGGAEVRQSSLEASHTNDGRVLPAGKAEAGQFSLVIENPKQGETVGMREDLTGRIESEGWPVIFVQADIPGQPWWCQAPVAKVEGGRFTTKVVFGDEFTPPGTKYRIAGIIIRTREEALKFNIGSKQQVLPEGFPRSVEVVVTHQ